MKNYNDYNEYYSHGQHAYDVHARPLPVTAPAPRTAPHPKKVAVPQIELKVMGLSKLSLLLILAIAAFLFVSIYFVAAGQGNERALRHTRRAIIETRQEIAAAQSVINESYNLADIEARATDFDMARPAPHQEIRVYVDRPAFMEWMIR